MKSLAELQAIKERMQSKVALREGSGEKRVVVGMATCGIAAGARPVLNAFVEQVEAAGLSGSITVTQCANQGAVSNDTAASLLRRPTPQAS